MTEDITGVTGRREDKHSASKNAEGSTPVAEPLTQNAQCHNRSCWWLDSLKSLECPRCRLRDQICIAVPGKGYMYVALLKI
jgi:hypothetical protein